MFGTPEQRAAEEQRRAKKLEQFRPTWKKVTFALFERAEIPVTYRGPKDKWRGFSKSLLYSFTPKWVPNPNATGRYNLVIEGRESYASETVFEYSPNMIDKNHKETSLGQCFLLELSVHSSINNDNSLSEKAQSKQQKQVERRARLGRRSTEGLDTLVHKSVKQSRMYSQHNKERYIRMVRGIETQEPMEIDFEVIFPAMTPGQLPSFSITRPLAQPVVVDTQSETPRRQTLSRLKMAIQEQPTRRPTSRPSLESQSGSVMSPPPPVVRNQRTTGNAPFNCVWQHSFSPVSQHRQFNCCTSEEGCDLMFPR
jgi:hypothetical protein